MDITLIFENQDMVINS